MKKKITFEKEKETPNTIRFKEKNEPGTPPVMGTLYLQKWFIGDVSSVQVTIEFGDTGEDDLKI